ALGHIHRRAEYRGRATIVMPGIPQGRDIGEAGANSVTLVSVADDHSVTLQQRTVACLRFDRIRLDCSDISDWSDLLAALEQGIRAAGSAGRPEEHLVIRPVLEGATPLAWRMARDLDRLTEEARAFAAASGLWIDKLEVLAVGTEDQGKAAGSHLPAD